MAEIYTVEADGKHICTAPLSRIGGMKYLDKLRGLKGIKVERRKE